MKELFDVKVASNFEKLSAQLKEIGSQFGRRIVRSATGAAAAVFARAARKNAPVLQTVKSKNRVAGALKRNIFFKRSKRSSNGSEQYYVGVRSGKRAKGGGDPFYWYFLEHGWVPRGRGNRRKGGDRIKAVMRKRDIAAGKQVKYPFIAPAFETEKEKAVEAFFKRAQAGFEKFSQMRTPR